MASKTALPPKSGPSRRGLLKGAAAVAGAAVGSGAVTGFPTIWAQNIKDVVLHHAGPPVTAIPAIAEQATKDLGFTVHMQASENADLLNRFLSQSSAIDCADVSIVYHALSGRPRRPADDPARQGQGLGQDDSAVHQGRISRRPQGARSRASRRYTVLYATGPDGQKVADGTPTEWLTGMPTVTNADTLGIRPDLVGPADQQLGRSVQPRIQGQGGAAGPADRRRHRRRDGDGGARRHQVRQQGQHDEGRDRQDHRR